MLLLEMKPGIPPSGILAGRLHLPNVAVVEGQLLDPLAADAIAAAVADVGEQGATGEQHENGGGRAHAAELGTRLPTDVDLVVGVENRGQNGLGGRLIEQFAVVQRDDVGGHFAGQFARRVSPHAVGHHEDVAALAKVVLAPRQHHGVGILVVARRRPMSLKAATSRQWLQIPAV